jgi:hypothetical protein
MLDWWIIEELKRLKQQPEAPQPTIQIENIPYYPPQPQQEEAPADKRGVIIIDLN